MNAQGLAEFAMADKAIQKDHLAMLRSVWRTNQRRGGASRERLMLGLVPAVEAAARKAARERQQSEQGAWYVHFPDIVCADATVLLTDMCIAQWEKRS